MNLTREDNPKYKISEKGKSSLTTVELLAILLKNGINMEESLELARNLLAKCENNLYELSRKGHEELMRIGLSNDKASIIVAAFELYNRKIAEGALYREKIAGSRDVFDYMRFLSDETYESFYCIYLNRANRVIQSKAIGIGGVNGTVSDPKRIFNNALLLNATGIILVHNHPSGNIQPSESDIRLTRKLKDGGLLLDISVLDHVIIGTDTYFSFADEGMI